MSWAKAARLPGRLGSIWTASQPTRSTEGMLLRATNVAAVIGLSAQAADVQTLSARVVGVHDGGKSSSVRE